MFIQTDRGGGGWAPAEGPGEEGVRPKRLYKAPTDNTKPQKDYTKPQNIIQSPDRLYKAPKRVYKDIKY